MPRKSTNSKPKEKLPKKQPTYMQPTPAPRLSKAVNNYESIRAAIDNEMEMKVQVQQQQSRQPKKSKFQIA